MMGKKSFFAFLVLLAGAAALGARCYLGARRNKEIEAEEAAEKK